MLDWIFIAVGGGLLAAGCATGSIVTKMLQRILFSRKAKQEAAVKEAVSAQGDVEAARDGQGDGMEDLLFDEKLKLLVMKENLKKKLLQQKHIIRQLMCGDRKREAAAAVPAAAAAAAAGIGGAGDNATSDEPISDRQAKKAAEVEYFASELELSKWHN